MLSRHNIRIKVLQALYSFAQSENPDPAQAEKQYLLSVDESFRLFMLNFRYLIKIAEYSKAPNDILMYCKFSNKAKPSPTEKPIWNPLSGESMSLYKLNTNAALHNSSPTGALTARSSNSPILPGSKLSTPNRITSNGKSKELITIAGIVDSIPAISMLSPSLLLVSNWK